MKCLFRENSHLTKKKKHFLDGIFLIEIWLKVGDHEHIYIFEIKCEKNYSV